MPDKQMISVEGQTKTYLCPVTIEQDEDVWRAFVPSLETQGASTWGHTPDEAFTNLREVVALVIENILEHGERLPDGVQMSRQPVLAVTV